MRAIDQRTRRQRHELGQGSVHLLGRAFEQAAAAHGKQRVAAEQRAFEGIGIVARRVRRAIDDAADVAADLHRIAFHHGTADVRYLGGLGLRASYLCTRGGHDIGIAAHMIGMPVGVQDLGDLPAPAGRGLKHRASDGRIDHRRFAAGGIMGEPDIIVGKHRHANDIKHLTSSRYWAPTPRVRPEPAPDQPAAIPPKSHPAISRTPCGHPAAAG